MSQELGRIEFRIVDMDAVQALLICQDPNAWSASCWHWQLTDSCEFILLSDQWVMEKGKSLPHATPLFWSPGYSQMGQSCIRMFYDRTRRLARGTIQEMGVFSQRL